MLKVISVLAQAITNRGDLQGCMECYGGPLVIPPDDPNGLMCDMCFHHYKNAEAVYIYDITVELGTKARAREREYLARLWEEISPVGDKISPDAFAAMHMSPDRTWGAKAKEVAYRINESKIKGVSSRFRMRRGWHYCGPFIKERTEPPTLGFWVDWGLRLYASYEIASKFMFLSGKPKIVNSETPSVSAVK